jgi:predicted Zn finger-like uncharacterized protein
MAMIIACPQCTTRYTVGDAAFRAPGRTVRCTTCDHTWFQAPPRPMAQPAQAVALADGPADDAIEAGDEHIETDAARMVAAARASAARFRAGVTRRRGALREWALLVAGIALIVVGGLSFREAVVRIAPATARVFEAVGLSVNVRGLDFLDVAYQRQYENGVTVLAIEGKVVNITDETQSVPKLRFGLRDGLRQELYHWYMKVTKAPLPPGEAVPFTARLASPPAEAYAVEVRFATAAETGSPFRP